MIPEPPVRRQPLAVELYDARREKRARIFARLRLVGFVLAAVAIVGAGAALALARYGGAYTAHEWESRLDLPDAESARALVGRLGEAVGFYKVGLGLLAGGGLELAGALKGEGKRVFLDLKLFDIGATVNGTCALLVDGRIFCWGSNLNGELGDGGVLVDSATPVEVTIR